METIREYLRKTIGSRKFMAAVAASLPFALAHDWTNFALVWMAYAGIEGVVDATSSVGAKKTVNAGNVSVLGAIDESVAEKIAEGMAKVKSS